MKRNLEILILTFFITVTCCHCPLFSQNTKSTSISTNIPGLAFGDMSLYYEINKVDTFKFGFILGYLIANRWLQSIGFDIANDDMTPILAYNGPQLRLYYMFPLNNRKQNKYFGVEILGKYLYYKTTTFIDSYREYDTSVYYNRDEKTYVVGCEFKYCKDFCSGKVFHQIFLGGGLRVKFRDINTTKTSKDFPSFRPVGHKQITNLYPIINIGFKLGKLWSK